jgi:hypothetical protein
LTFNAIILPYLKDIIVIFKVNGGMMRCISPPGMDYTYAFQKSQRRLIIKVSEQIMLLGALAIALTNKSRLNAKEVEIQNRLNKYIKPGAGTYPAIIMEVIAAARGALKDLRGNKRAIFVPGKTIGGAYGRSLRFEGLIKLNADKFYPIPRGQGFSFNFERTLLHEVIHSGSENKIGDYPLGCEKCYVGPYVKRIARNNKAGLENAENIVYVLDMGERQYL